MRFPHARPGGALGDDFVFVADLADHFKGHDPWFKKGRRLHFPRGDDTWAGGFERDRRGDAAQLYCHTAFAGARVRVSLAADFSRGPGAGGTECRTPAEHSDENACKTTGHAAAA
jgi:hypothetical protein